MSDTTLARPFGVALGVHLGAGTTIALFSWLSLGAIPGPPDLRPIFHPPSPIPVIFESGGARPAPRREAPRPAPATRELQQPIVTPEPLPPTAQAPPADTFVEGDPTLAGPPGSDGDGNGRGTGSEGPGLFDGPPGEDLGPPQDGPIEVTGTMTAPRLVLKVSPEYPKIAQAARVSGTVILRAVIAPDGSVEEVEVVRAASPLLVEAAKEAVLRWRYTPALQSGQPVRVYFNAVVEFKLR